MRCINYWGLSCHDLFSAPMPCICQVNFLFSLITFHFLFPSLHLLSLESPLFKFHPQNITLYESFSGLPCDLSGKIFFELSFNGLLSTKTIPTFKDCCLQVIIPNASINSRKCTANFSVSALFRKYYWQTSQMLQTSGWSFWVPTLRLMTRGFKLFKVCCILVGYLDVWLESLRAFLKDFFVACFNNLALKLYREFSMF